MILSTYFYLQNQILCVEYAEKRVHYSIKAKKIEMKMKKKKKPTSCSIKREIVANFSLTILSHFTLYMYK